MNESDKDVRSYIIAEIDENIKKFRGLSSLQSANLAIVHGVYHASGYYGLDGLDDETKEKHINSGISSYVTIKEANFLSDAVQIQ